MEVKPYGIRTTIISPGAVATELADSVTEPDLQERTRALYAMAIPADVIARAIAYVIAEPAEVDVNEILVRPRRRSSEARSCCPSVPPSPPGEGDRHPESDGGLRRKGRELAIGHPFAGHEEVDRRQALANADVADPEAERQRRRAVAIPIDRPGGIGGFQIEAPPDVGDARSVESTACSSGCDPETCRRRRWGSGSGPPTRSRGWPCRPPRPRDRLATPPAPRSCPSPSERRTPARRPRAVPSPCWIPGARRSRRAACRRTRCASRSLCPSGTVTSEKLGRMSWTNGNSENLGMRGTIALAITRLVWASVP